MTTHPDAPAAPQTRQRPGWRVFVLSATLMVAGIVIAFASFTYAGWWWNGGGAEVPRDGSSHEVAVFEPGSDYALWSEQWLIDPECEIVDATGNAVELRAVPPSERTTVEMQGVGDPEVSFVFTAPETDTMTVTCAAIESNPVVAVEVGPAPIGLYVALMNWGPGLLGVGLWLAGVAVLIYGAWHHVPTRRQDA
ncbi:hypothetical protein [Nocardioides campestrisoli]|uniref:hypothetical protein n=1 Tax=Nocardioides campestrisoli TaxID=2736757 RepID=UPI00163D81C3|nr:hypothetical protein [Nocardioides campestrisoli]